MPVDARSRQGRLYPAAVMELVCLQTVGRGKRPSMQASIGHCMRQPQPPTSSLPGRPACGGTGQGAPTVQAPYAARMGGADRQVDEAVGSNEFVDLAVRPRSHRHLPMRCLVAIAQALAALTHTVLDSSSIAARTISPNCGPLAHHPIGARV